MKNLVVGDKIAVPREEALERHKGGEISNKKEEIKKNEEGKINVRIGKGDLRWDEIVSIEKVGEERVYDIEVDSTHNFVGNDIFAHNTYLGNLEVEKQARENEVDALKVANVAQDEAIDQTELAVESLDSRLDTVESTSIAYSTELEEINKKLAELEAANDQFSIFGTGIEFTT